MEKQKATEWPPHDSMIEGYFDGLNDTRIDPPPLSNRSYCYQHGWLNGRDDRVKKPRALAATLGLDADVAELRDAQNGAFAP